MPKGRGTRRRCGGLTDRRARCFARAPARICAHARSTRTRAPIHWFLGIRDMRRAPSGGGASPAAIGGRCGKTAGAKRKESRWRPCCAALRPRRPRRRRRRIGRTRRSCRPAREMKAVSGTVGMFAGMVLPLGEDFIQQCFAILHLRMNHSGPPTLSTNLQYLGASGVHYWGAHGFGC